MNMLKAITAGRSINLEEEMNTLHHKMNRLNSRHSDVLDEVQQQEMQPGKKRKSEVDHWFGLVDEKKMKFEELKSDLQQLGPSGELKNKIERETKRVDELVQQGQFPGGVVLDDHASTRVQLVATNLVGKICEDNDNKIWKWLKDDAVFLIGIYGLGGVGKTSLLRQIHNRLLTDSDIAGQVYWVTASRDCSLQKKA